MISLTLCSTAENTSLLNFHGINPPPLLNQATSRVPARFKQYLCRVKKHEFTKCVINYTWGYIEVSLSSSMRPIKQSLSLGNKTIVHFRSYSNAAVRGDGVDKTSNKILIKGMSDQ